MKFSMEPTSARRVLRQAGDRVADLATVAREARAVDAGDAGSLLVGGAVSVFFEDRADAVETLRSRADAVILGAGEVIEIYETGDREMARQTDEAARRAQPSGGDGPGGSGRAW
ncbi:DUF6507 family protein [Promicromonospora sp. NPDC057488]|uniref:DUF6507 family protein n=1 Tax=Promicromonospora sp. NPDC057488 TaxID=3346147 RepID=UPI003672BE42